jgi:hypothetical protein
MKGTPAFLHTAAMLFATSIMRRVDPPFSLS